MSLVMFNNPTLFIKHNFNCFGVLKDNYRNPWAIKLLAAGLRKAWANKSTTLNSDMYCVLMELDFILDDYTITDKGLNFLNDERVNK